MPARYPDGRFSLLCYEKRNVWTIYNSITERDLLKANVAAPLGKSPGTGLQFAQNPRLHAICFWPPPDTRLKQTALQRGATVTNVHQKVTYGTEAEKVLTPRR